MTSALNGGGWSAPRPGRFTPGNEPVLIVQEAGWAPGPVWTGAENRSGSSGKLFVFEVFLVMLVLIGLTNKVPG